MIIDRRYNGPPDTGNGGYCAGALAVASGLVEDGPVEVTLRLPPPLGVPLRVEPAADHVGLWDGDRLVAQARSAPRPDDGSAQPAGPVSWAEAAAAALHSPALSASPFPTCFVCGVQRPDGMRLFPGRLPDGATATPWTVPADIRPELVWAALDCPGGWAIPLERQAHVLGRFTVEILRQPAPGQRCVIMGHLTGVQGRKASVTTAVYDGDGTRLAHASAVWIALAP